MVLPSFFKSLVGDDASNEMSNVDQEVLLAGNLSPEEQDDYLAQMFAKHPLVQNEIRPVFSESRDLMSRFFAFLDTTKADQKVEACIQNRCGDMEKRSIQLRERGVLGTATAGQPLLWSIKEANDDFVLQDCYAKCERPLAVFNGWAEHAGETYLARFMSCLESVQSIDNPSAETINSVKICVRESSKRHKLLISEMEREFPKVEAEIF